MMSDNSRRMTLLRQDELDVIEYFSTRPVLPTYFNRARKEQALAFLESQMKLGINSFELHSQVDVDRVDFEKFPGLSDVTYYTATLEEGDCLFTPYRWFHQVRSYPDKTGQCIAVNVWFNHIHNHRPVNCDTRPEDATMDKYHFNYENTDNEEEDSNEDEDEGIRKDDDHLQVTLEQIKRLAEFVENERRKRGLNLRYFLKVLQLDIASKEKEKLMNTPASFTKLGEQLMHLIDKDQDGVLTSEELLDILERPKESTVDIHHAFMKVNLYVHDLVEFKHHGGKEEDFEEYRKERIEERKHMYSFKEEL